MTHHAFGDAGGGADASGPRFDLTVPSGGYGWWYVDAVSDDGVHGLTIIIMIGGVFSPYYGWAGYRDPYNHVGVNVALYGAGPNRWAFTERRRDTISQSQNQISIGPSSAVWDGKQLRIDIKERGAPLPRKVSGTVRLTPNWRTHEGHQLDHKGRHFWHPIAPSSRVDVAFDHPKLAWSGSGYFDSNWGSEMLQDGFQYWDWCRSALTDGAAIYYDALDRDGQRNRFALHYDTQGSTHKTDCPASIPLTPGPIWRVKRSVPAPEGYTPKTHLMLEDTPFYTRSHITARFDGEDVLAVHESLDLDRFSKPWVRCLLPFRMPRV